MALLSNFISCPKSTAFDLQRVIDRSSCNVRLSRRYALTPRCSDVSRQTKGGTASLSTKDSGRSPLYLTYLEGNSWLWEVRGVNILVDPILVGNLDFGVPWLYDAAKKTLKNFRLEDLPDLDCLVITQSLDDHCHKRTLQPLSKMYQNLRVVSTPNAEPILKTLFNEVTKQVDHDSNTNEDSYQMQDHLVEQGFDPPFEGEHHEDESYEIMKNESNDMTTAQSIKITKVQVQGLPNVPVDKVQIIATHLHLHQVSSTYSLPTSFYDKETYVIIKVTYIEPGQKTQLRGKNGSELIIRASAGPILGPPWQRPENGYFIEADDGKFTLYYEPHCVYDRSLLAREQADVIITPVIKQLLPAFTLVSGQEDAVELARLLQARFIVPMKNGDLESKGILSKIIFAYGTTESFKALLSKALPNVQVLEPTPGIPLEVPLGI